MPWFRSLCVSLLSATLVGAADWPQWLGPTRDGVSSEAVTPWTEAPKVLWRQPVGEGHSSPIVAGGRVFYHSKVKDKDEEEVVALDAETGKLIWRASYPRASFGSIFGNGPRGTPAFADGKVYALGVTGVLTCCEAATGRQLWQVDTLKKFAGKNLLFGMSCSPLVEQGKVMVDVGAKGASVVAFNEDTGDVVWKCLDDRASYSSPIIFGGGSKRQVVFFTHDGLVSLNPADGSLLWRFALVDALSESSSTPLHVGDMLLASSITYGSVGLRLDPKGDKPAAEQVWKNPDLTCYFSTPVTVDAEHTLVVTGTKPSLNPLAQQQIQATLHCIETKTGKELWKQPKVGKYHASLLRTGNNKFLLLDDAGNLMLLEPSLTEYRELARSKICGETWAHPALANGRVYVRDNKELICVQLAP
jgi:outer membrane protein assembly factor BamB